MPNIVFTPEIADHVLDRYTAGESLLAISKSPNVPSYQTLLRWLRNTPEFKHKLQAARELRAIHMEEKAIEVATSPEDKEQVPAARLSFDAYKWAAEVNDPTTYGRKTTVQGNPDQPIQIVIKTGVPDQQLAITPVIDVESEVANITDITPEKEIPAGEKQESPTADTGTGRTGDGVCTPDAAIPVAPPAEEIQCSGDASEIR